jgi:hypothetical protein
MSPYTVHAVYEDGTPAAIQLMARSAADALLVAAELFTRLHPCLRRAGGGVVSWNPPDP